MTVLLGLGLTLLPPGSAHAQTDYKIQPVVRLGDTVAGVVLKKNGFLGIENLNDRGQLSFGAADANGADALFQYVDGRFIPLAVAGREAPEPGGKWPNDLFIAGRGNMNQSGNLVFPAGRIAGGNFQGDTYLWDAAAELITVVARKGMPAVNNLTFAQGGGSGPAINNRGDIALVAHVTNAVGQAKQGVYFRSPDGQLLPVVLPNQVLPNGRKAVEAIFPTLNDAGVVAVPVRQEGAGAEEFSVYLWQKGELRPAAIIDTEAPGGGRIAAVFDTFVNNKNGNALVTLRVNRSSGPEGLYLFADDSLRPVAVPGQEMPGGGKLVSVDHNLVSFANEMGQHAFVARLEGGATAAYQMDADGQLSLILKSGASTELGTITRVSHSGSSSPAYGLALNSKGQVALSVRIAASDMIVLLTPADP
jgi:hypothetical protein